VKKYFFQKFSREKILSLAQDKGYFECKIVSAGQEGYWFNKTKRISRQEGYWCALKTFVH